MADRIKGITIEIGGDTTGLNKALSGVNKEISNTQGQLKDVERLLKLDPTNTELLRQKQKLLGDAVKETKSKLDTLKLANEQVAQSAGKYDAWKEKYDPIKNQIDETKKKLNELKTQSKDADTQLANGEISKEKYDAIQAEVKETSRQLHNLQEAARDVTDEFGNPVSPEQYDALQREIAETEQRLKSLEDQAGKSNHILKDIGNAGEKFQEVGQKIEGVGKKLLPITGAIATIGGASAKMSMDFEDAMAKVNTIADTSKVPLSELQTAIMELSNQTGISAEEIANNVYDAISAGQETGDAVNFVSNSTKLAKAGFADAGSALDILTTIMNAYGLEASEVNRVSDVLVQTQNLGKTTVGELSSAMGKIIPTAKANEVALEQVAAGYAIMTANGVATAESTTYMNSMLNELGKSGTQVSDTLKKKTGKSFKELMESGSSLSDVLAIVSESAAEQELAFGDLWSSAEAGKAAMILLGDDVENFNGVLGEMQNSTGATETAFGKLDTKSYQLQKTLNQMKNDAITLGNAILQTLSPTFEKISEKMQELHEWFNLMDEKQRETVVVIGMVTAAIGPLLIAIGKVSIGIGAIMKTLPAMSTTFAAMSASGGPLLLATLAISGVASALIIAEDKANSYQEAVWELSDAEKAIAEKVNETRSAYDELSQRRQESVTDIDTQAEHENELWKELQNITDENGKVKSGYEDRAKFIVTTLNEALGTEIQMNGDIIKGYKDIQGEIDKLIEKKRAEATLNAYEEEYSAAIKNRKEAQERLTEAVGYSKAATDDYNEALKREKELQEECKRVQEESLKDGTNDALRQQYYDLQDQMIAAGEATDGFKGRMEANNQSLEAAREEVEKYNTTIANYEGASAAIISGDQEKISYSLMMLQNDFKIMETSTAESLQTQKDTITQKLEETKQAISDGSKDYSTEYVSNLEKLKEEASVQLALLTIVAGDSAGDAAKAVKEKAPEMESAGLNIAGGAAKGIRDGTKEVLESATELAENAINAITALLQINSPSRVTMEAGRFFTEGFSEGIAQEAARVESAVGQVVSAATTTLDTQLKASNSASQLYQSGMSTSWNTWAANLESTINTTLAGIGTGTTAKLGTVKLLFSETTNDINSDWNTKWTAIETKHKTTVDKIKALTETVLQAIKTLSRTETNTIKTDAITTMNQMVAGIETELKNLEPTVKAGFDPAVKHITELIPKARIWANDMMDGYIEGIREKMDELEDACEDVAEIVSDYMHFTRPEKGPLKYYEEWMPHMMQGLARGIQQNKNLVTDQMRILTQDMAAIQAAAGSGSKQEINFSNRSILILDGRQIAESVDEYLGGVYG